MKLPADYRNIFEFQWQALHKVSVFYTYLILSSQKSFLLQTPPNDFVLKGEGFAWGLITHLFGLRFGDRLIIFISPKLHPNYKDKNSGTYWVRDNKDEETHTKSIATIM